MKILSTPIEVLAYYEESGKINPLRFKLNGETIKVEHVISMAEEKLAGNRMLVFCCQSEIKGEVRPFELKYEVNTCKWYLWKM